MNKKISLILNFIACLCLLVCIIPDPTGGFWLGFFVMSTGALACNLEDWLLQKKKFQTGKWRKWIKALVAVYLLIVLLIILYLFILLIVHRA